MKLFDQPLINVALSTGSVIPSFLEQCFQFVLDHVETEGVFRVPGSDEQVKRFISLIDATGIIEIPENTNVFNICNVISRFIKRIPDHLLIDKEVKRWKNKDMTAEEVKANIVLLPLVNQVFLSRIFAFFKKVSEHSAQNKMVPLNIAKIVSAILIDDNNEKYWLLDPAIVMHFFNSYYDIFGSLTSLNKETGEFIEAGAFQQAIGDVFSDFFCQSYANGRPEISVAPLKQKKMCQNLRPTVLNWGQMFDVLISSSQSA